MNPMPSPRYIWVLFFQMVVFSSINAQIKITGLITDSLNHPIPYATVYLSKTTIGCYTDDNGMYSLQVFQEGNYDLVATSIGYYSVTKNIQVKEVSLNYNLILKANPISIEEVTIKAKDKNRMTNISPFLKLFLGESSNAQGCKVLNPEDLRIYKDAQDNITKGYSVKSIKIENRILGYTILYDLLNFKYQQQTKLLSFSGNLFFQPMKGNAKKEKQWETNRKLAYYGSRQHFLRSLVKESLSSESFIISECTINPKNDEFTIGNNLSEQSLKFPSNNRFINLYYQKPVLVRYTENHPELTSSLLGFQATLHTSTMQFKETAKLDKDGHLENPNSIIWGGDMINERVADMLPFDYLPNVSTVGNDNSSSFKSQLDQKITQFYQKECSEDVFLQTDRNLYTQGDTVFFQAFIRQRSSLEYNTKSHSLYVILFNSDKSIVDSARFRISGATSSGWLVIPMNANKEIFRLKAFTSQMQLFNNQKGFQLDLSVVPHKYSDSNQGISYDKIQNTIGNPSDSIANNLPAPDENLNIRLDILPEGGNLVEGIPQNIGIIATNSDGETVQFKGLLKNRFEEVIDTIQSGPYGPALLKCTPESGMYIKLGGKDYSKKMWMFPPFSNPPVCMSLAPLNTHSYSLKVQSSGYRNEKYFIAGVMNGLLFFEKEFHLDKQLEYVVDTEDLPEGIGQISLFDKDMRLISDRVVYINAYKHLNIQVNQDSLGKNESDELAFHILFKSWNDLPQKGIFTISVIDSSSGFDPRLFIPNINYTINYHPYLLKNLPPKALKIGLENLTDKQRDLLFLVYGWKKIKWNWKDTLNNNPFLKDNYEYLTINLINTPQNKLAGQKLKLFCMEGPSVIDLKTDNKGSINLPLDSLPIMVKTISLMPDPQNKYRGLQANFTIPVNSNFFNYPTSDTLPRFTSVFDVKNPKDSLSFSEKTIEISKVTILGKKKDNQKFKNTYEEFYKNNQIKSIGQSELNETSTVAVALYKITNPDIVDNKVYIQPKTSFFGDRVPALFVLDGLPLYNEGFTTVNALPTSEIVSISVLKGPQGWGLFGEPAKGGVIFINTRAKTHSSSNSTYYRRDKNSANKISQTVEIFRPQIEYFNPTKLEFQTIPEYFRKPTIFWENEVLFDENQPFKLKIRLPSHHGTFIIRINGVSLSNLAGSSTHIFYVK